MDRDTGSSNPWEYLDFELKIREGVGPREYPVCVRSSPAGEAQEQMRFPFDKWELKDKLQALENTLLRSGSGRRRVRLPEGQTIEDFGRGLFEALLSGEVRTRYAAENSLHKRYLRQVSTYSESLDPTYKEEVACSNQASPTLEEQRFAGRTWDTMRWVGRYRSSVHQLYTNAVLSTM